ncbi:MAG: hypothetical protein ABSE89_11395 [Sedimentisphaerales bacterium]
MATLPVLMFMAGCGGPNTNTTYNDISDDSSGNGGYQTVTVIDYAAIQKNNLEEMRRSKESMFRTIDQQFGIPPSRQDGHEHH